MTNALRPIVGDTATSRRGWLRFADLLATLVGASHVIAGLLAWFHSGFYLVPSHGLALAITYPSWGWAHLVLGGLLISTAVYATRPWEIFVLVVLISVSVLVNLTFLAAHPVWSALVIGLDVVTLHALVVHGQNHRLSSR